VALHRFDSQDPESPPREPAIPTPRVSGARSQRPTPASRRAAGALALLAYAAIFGALGARWLADHGPDGWPGHLLLGALCLLLALAATPIAIRLIGHAPRGSTRRGRARVRSIAAAIERGELELHYQPQIDLGDGRPYGVEALLRWRRGRELIGPAEFLPEVESGELIGPLTTHVLELALVQAERWHRAGRSLRVASNLSAANLRDFGVASELERLLGEYRIPAPMLTLEVTETSVLDEPEKARAVLDEIARLGVRLSVDDFGTGYSSLLWLRAFPVHEIKIDRTFVSRMETEGEAFVSGVVRLGHDLGLSVVAEGVEKRSILEGLQALGCDAAQGYLFARPLPAGELERWLDAASSGPWAPRRTEVSLRPTYDQIDEARRLIHIAADAAGLDEAGIWDLKVAATEALSNAIEHAPLSTDGMIHLRITQERGDLTLEVWGGGSRDTVTAARDPSRGRGIGIMTALMDDVELTRHSDGDALVRLTKRLNETKEQV
jgi:EAL domain-containing protein (putative c-di-GMP-specific phosphodiesterase class I)/anti-sigma regulatory factor (Ser/Thr protein kinase)